MIGREEIESLFQGSRVHRRVYVDPEIFEVELDRVFGRAWLYVAHESQLKASGDFVRAQLPQFDILIVRGKDGQLRGLHNRCAHRGVKLCRENRGNVQAFTCPYHAWTFSLDGSLMSVPHSTSYPDGFLDAPGNQLFRVPRLESYRGFVFVSLSPSGPTLRQYLGPMVGAFDNLVDRSPKGEIEISSSSFRLEYKGNWKLHNENANDNFHAGFVHQSSIAAARKSPRGSSKVDPDSLTWIQLESNARTSREWENLVRVSYPSGHHYGAGFYRKGVLAPSRNAESPVQQAYMIALAKRFGQEGANEIVGVDRFNNLIYPNLNINAQYQQMRYAIPLAIDRTLVTYTCFRLKGAPDEMFHRAVRFMSNLGSPASMIFADDVEIFNRCQAGLSERGSDWMDFGRGLDMGELGSDGGERSTASEATMRCQLEAWKRDMTEDLT